jgi:hypothetical protein
MVLGGMVLSAGGTAIAGMGEAAAQEQRAENVARTSEARAATDRFNASVLERDAQNILDVAEADALDFVFKGSKELATFRAGVGGSGFTNEGSFIAIQEDDMAELAFGRERIGTQSRGEAQAKRDQARLTRHNASIETENARRARKSGKKQAKITRIAALTSSAGQALSGGGSLLAGRSSGVGEFNTVTTNAQGSIL